MRKAKPQARVASGRRATMSHRRVRISPVIAAGRPASATRKAVAGRPFRARAQPRTRAVSPWISTASTAPSTAGVRSAASRAASQARQPLRPLPVRPAPVAAAVRRAASIRWVSAPAARTSQIGIGSWTSLRS
jgi:hypothetical protein